MPFSINQRKISPSQIFSNGVNALPMIYGTVPIPRCDYSRKWNERITNSHSVACLFTMEVQMHKVNEETAPRFSVPTNMELPSQSVRNFYEIFGLSLELVSIPFPVQARGPRFAYCAGVVESGFLAPVIQPGDLLLSMGQSGLVFGLPGLSDPVVSHAPDHCVTPLDQICTIVMQSTVPASLRFLRRSGLAPNNLLSPAEIVLLIREVAPIARFSVISSQSSPETAPTLKVSLQNVENNVSQ
jgi:hypothetical protein